MPTCEAIQIAHEMHAHGAVAPLSAADVERHVETCEACTGYVAQSRRIDMSAFAIPETEFLHVAAIGRRLPRLRRELLYGLVITAVLCAFSVVTRSWGGMIGVLIALGWQWRVVDRRSRRIEAALVTGGTGLLETLRADLRDEIDRAQRNSLYIPLAGIMMVLVTLHEPLQMIFLGVLFAGSVIYYWYWMRARMRELESLG